MKFIIILVAMLMMPIISISQSLRQLPADESYRIGKLENGLTYYIRHNELPKDQACFYIAQNVGSMQEEESQRGLAHFLEHMAFNGTEHFPGDRIIKFLEANGIKFGAELNAYTSFDETVYNINSVPTNKGEALLDSCLQILADWSGGISLLDSEIDKERGVIKSEYVMRRSAAMRQYDQLLPVILKGSKYADRMPIGLMTVVEGCTYDELRNYYKKWYHPSQQAIIVVGDIDVDKIEQKIKAMFAKYKNPENEAPRVEHDCLNNDEPIYAAAKDKEQANTQIYLCFKTPALDRDIRGTEAHYFYDLASGLVSTMLNNRFEEINSKSTSPMLYAGGGIENYVVARSMNALTLVGVPKPGQEKDCYKALLREALRIKKHGFNQSELDRAKADMIKHYENNAINKDKHQNTEYVQICVNNFLNHDEMMDWDTELKEAKKMMELLSLDKLNTMADNIITDNGYNMVAFSFGPDNDGETTISEETYKQATAEVYAETMESYKDDVITEPLLSKIPKNGKIVSEVEDKDYGVKILKLGNGARVILKKTDFKQDEILFSAYSHGGTSLYENKDFANIYFLSDVIESVGLGKFSSTQVTKLSQGKTLSTYISIGNTYESIGGSCTPKDLDYFMQTVYCMFTQPGSNEEDFANLKEMIRQYLVRRKLMHTEALSDTIQNNKYCFNPRVRPFEESDIDNMDLKRMVKMYKERFADASNFTFMFVGNFDEQNMKAEICRYIASLPSTNSNETFIKGRADYNKQIVNLAFERKMETPESRVEIYYINNDFKYNLENDIKISVLSQAIQTLLFQKIREESSIAYNTGCRASFSVSEKPGYGYLELRLANPVKPEYGKLACNMMNDIVDSVCINGINQDDLDKIKAFMVKHNAELQKENSYWQRMISSRYINNADMMHNYDEIVNSITLTDLQELLKKIVSTSAKETYMMLPKGVEQKMELEKN